MPPRRLLVDLSPLRGSRDFPVLFLSGTVSTLGIQMTAVAVPYQVYEITHSSLMVGLVSLGQLLPLVAFSIIGGPFIDAHDRRRILVVVELLLALTSIGLIVNGLSAHPVLWPMFLFTALASALSSFDRPAYNAMTPSFVTEEQMPSAYTLWQINNTLGVVVGPAIAGVLLSVGGAGVVYIVDMATYLVAFCGALIIRPVPPSGRATKPGLKAIREGFAYLKASPMLQGVYLFDINAMVFGMPRALFPALGLTVFHGGARTVGLLYAAPGLGALIGAVGTGWVPRVRRQGLAVVLAVLGWGAAIAAFGLVKALPGALILLALAGWADVISAVFRNTILQTTVPDTFRGRMSAFQIAVVQGGPRLGDLESGSVADVFGPITSVISGGIACMAGTALLALLLPGFARYRSRTSSEGRLLPNESSPDPE